MTAPVQVGPSSAHGGPDLSPARHLTARHLQVLRLAANGHTNREIGDRLGTTEDTVKSQMAVILRRLHVDDRAQAVAVGMSLGLISRADITVSPRPEQVRRRARNVRDRRPADELAEELADIGDRIRAERKAQGLSEGALSERAGLDRGTLRRIQDGIGTLRHFIQVCAALGVGPDYLLSEQWVMPDSGPGLGEAQVAVLRAVASGQPIATVAEQLGMSSRAVESHLRRIYQRLGLTDLPVRERRAAAVRVAMQHGLFDPQNRTS